MKFLAIFFSFNFIIVYYSYGQLNNRLVIIAGIGKNYYTNTSNNNKSDFRFKSPTTLNVGIEFIKQIKSKNFLTTELSYSRKKVKIFFEFKEDFVPLSETLTTYEKFNCLSYAIGYRKEYGKKNISPFLGFKLNINYNVNYAIGQTNNSNGVGQLITDTIKYERNYSLNLDQRSIYFGCNLSFGCEFGKNKKSSIEYFVDFPFGKIQSKTSNLDYQWQYLNVNYSYDLSYKGYLTYTGIKFNYYVFRN
jgi:hypothetical protein